MKTSKKPIVDIRKTCKDEGVPCVLDGLESYGSMCSQSLGQDGLEANVRAVIRLIKKKCGLIPKKYQHLVGEPLGGYEVYYGPVYNEVGDWYIVSVILRKLADSKPHKLNKETERK